MRIAALFSKNTSGNNIAPAGDCQRASINIQDRGEYSVWNQQESTTRLIKKIPCEGEGFEKGIFTVNADVDEGVTCKVHLCSYVNDTWKNIYIGGRPAEGTTTLPYTFEISVIPRALYCGIIIEFGYGDTWGDTEILPEAVRDVSMIYGTEPYQGDNIETVLLRPDEISDEDEMAQAISSKMSAKLIVYPDFELWGFCYRHITYVTLMDMDLPSNRIIFRGRVSAITNVMNANGRKWQEITCVSTLDYLSDSISTQTWELKHRYALSDWIDPILQSYNSRHEKQREIQRGETSNVAIELVKPLGDAETTWEVITQSIANMNTYYGSTKVINELEIRERYAGGVTYLDIKSKPGVHHDTAIKIGENLKNIQVDQSITDNYATTIHARSGVYSNGERYTFTTSNPEMLSKYPKTVRVMTNDNIRCTGACYTYGTTTQILTEEHLEANERLREWAREQAEKLSDPPYTKITLTAVDLAQIGLAGYDGFELGDYYPCVCPPLGLTGQEMRITGIRRKLSDGKTAEITIETGDRIGNVGTLSSQVSQTANINSRIDDSEQAQTEISRTKAEDQNDGVKIRKMTKSQYDDLIIKDGDTIYKVDNNGTYEIYVGNDHIDSGGGGGDSYTIENAVVGTSSDWTMEREPLPTYFAGGNGLYYSGPPGRCVIQGQRALFNVTYNQLTASDVQSEITIEGDDSSKQRVRIFINQISMSSGSLSITPGAALMGVDSQGEETPIRQYVATAWTGIPLNASFQIGIIMRVGSLGQNGGQLRPFISMQMACMVNGSPFGTAKNTSTAGISGYVPWSTSEEHFGTTLLIKTEPSGGGN